MDHDPLCPHTDIVKGLVKPSYCTYCTLIRKTREHERKELIKSCGTAYLMTENKCPVGGSGRHIMMPIEALKNKTIKTVGRRCVMCGIKEEHDETR